MAAFTIDAFIKACAELNELPGVIVAMIDETRGADAIVASAADFPNVNSLNRPSTRFVLTADSPSETLARVVMSDFDLTELAPQPFDFTPSPEATVQRVRQDDNRANEVYVLWEPYVSEVLRDSAMHVVQDSAGFRGYIVDVLVVNREFLRLNEPVAREILACFLRASNSYRKDMPRLVLSDARETKSRLNAEQAAKLVKGIDWKSTLENYAHFGLLKDNKGREHIEDMIAKITNVLIETKGIQRDPADGQPAKLFNQKLLASLQEAGFHEALKAEPLTDLQTILPQLTNEQWNQLKQAGDLRVSSLVFAAGTARLTNFSKAALDRVVATLRTWPQYYLLVRGNASSRGSNPDANRRLAKQRAEAAAAYLIQKGIHPSRVHAIGSDPSGTTTVSFVLGEPSR